MTGILDEVFDPVIEERKKIMVDEGWPTQKYNDSEYELKLLEQLKQQLAERIKEKSYQIPFLVKSNSYPEQQPPYRVNLSDILGEQEK